MTAVMYMLPEDVPAMRHFLTACDPALVQYFFLVQVGTFDASSQLLH